MSRVLDRRIEFDPRSRDYPIRTLLAGATVRSYTWGCPVRLNQGQEGACVGFAWIHEFAARPKTHDLLTAQIARNIYMAAQLVDQWPSTPPEEGTSVLAGAKTMVDWGYLGEYRWAFDVNDLKLSVSTVGPAVLGLWWWSKMFETDAEGYIHPQGYKAGGHAILCNGYNLTRRAFRLTNSWGPNWGLNGTCWVHEDDMAALLADEGEACIPTRRTLVPEFRS